MFVRKLKRKLPGCLKTDYLLLTVDIGAIPVMHSCFADSTAIAGFCHIKVDSLTSAAVMTLPLICGWLSEVFIPHFPRTSKSRGYAFVRFKYEDDVRASKGVLDEKKIDGRAVSIKNAFPKNPPRLRAQFSPLRGGTRKVEDSPREAVVPGEALLPRKGWEKPSSTPFIDSGSNKTIFADPSAVNRKLQKLKLGLVGYSGEKNQALGAPSARIPQPIESQTLDTPPTTSPQDAVSKMKQPVSGAPDCKVHSSNYSAAIQVAGPH
ncbi:serine/arginine-rich splicing factor SC35-like [Magnolia sinica]|uniref:serine/arginine-rich splicing factor SC35-like n=1 Tax=Magnolia sinica TaxID=86752 RepID=UPI0026599CFC|nr:serine/arginine-rich splicing factor SC35-like [Magnolia sinica]